MQEQFAEIIAYAKGVVRYKWIVVITAWLVCIAGWSFVYTMNDRYTSQAKVHVDTRTMLRPLLRGIAVQADIRGLVAVMKKLMFTQQNMLKVAELAGIEGDYLSENGRFKIVEKLKSGLKISGGRGELFSITYDDTDPIRAQKVVQAVLTVFSEQTQQSTLSDVDSAQRFIDDQIKEYEQRLRNAEKARENFKRENLGLLPGEGSDQVGKMQAIKQQIEDEEHKLSEMISKRKVLQMQLTEALESDEEWGLTGIDNESEEDARIAELEKAKEELLFNYTEKHPRVVAIQKRIAELEKKKSENDIAMDDEPNFMAMSSPYAQTIKMAINQIDADIATARVRITNLKEQLQKVDEQFNARLAIETEMQNLNRDYETVKNNYLKLIERREQASLSEKVDNQSSSLKFKIADPANRPEKPSAPNRPLLYSAVLIGGFVVGIAVAVLLTFIKPVIISTRELRNITGLPVLGSVSVFLTEKDLRQRRINSLAFYCAIVLLFSGYSGVIAKELLLS